MQNFAAKVFYDGIFKSKDSTVLKEIGVNILATDLNCKINVFVKGILIKVSGFNLFR